MAETTPTTSETTVVVNKNHLCRLWTFTLISLSLNALILIILVVGCILHHHMEGRHHKHGFGCRGHEGCGRFEKHEHREFHQFRGGPWGKPGFDRNRFDDEGNGGMGFRDRGDREDGGDRGPRDGGFGKGPGGPGMMGMGGRGGMGRGPQGPPDPAKMTDMMLNHLSEKLTLTDDEKAKIKPILEAQAAQMQKDMEAQRATMQKSMEDTRAKIKPLLTPDQQKQLDAMPVPGQKPAAPATQPDKK